MRYFFLVLQFAFVFPLAAGTCAFCPCMKKPAEKPIVQKESDPSEETSQDHDDSYIAQHLEESSDTNDRDDSSDVDVIP